MSGSELNSDTVEKWDQGFPEEETPGNFWRKKKKDWLFNRPEDIDSN